MRFNPFFLKDYYGGRTLQELAGVVRRLNAKGLEACVAPLPGHRFDSKAVESEKERFLGIPSFLKSAGLSADLTVKLSQLGQRRLYGECLRALEEIAERCRAHGAFLWVDMEQSTLTDLTLEAFEGVARRLSNVGICLQTYLRRTERDLAALLKGGFSVRLVKGYYREWPPTAYPTWREVTENFERLIPPLLESSRRPAIGTHDPQVIAEAKRALEGRPGKKLEFQFFLGAREDLAQGLAREGKSVRIYIPYGDLIPYLLHTLPFMDLSRNLQRLLGFSTIR